MFLPTLPKLTAAARTWSIDSQQVARRNAMIAATQCAQRRAERQDVEDYLTALTAATHTKPSARAAQR
jgi:hypothetical protein